MLDDAADARDKPKSDDEARCEGEPSGVVSVVESERVLCAALDPWVVLDRLRSCIAIDSQADAGKGGGGVNARRTPAASELPMPSFAEASAAIHEPL